MNTELTEDTPLLRSGHVDSNQNKKILVITQDVNVTLKTKRNLHQKHCQNIKNVFEYVKIGLLLIIFFCLVVLFMISDEEITKFHHTDVSSSKPYIHFINSTSEDSIFRISSEGSYSNRDPDETTDNITFTISDAVNNATSNWVLVFDKSELDEQTSSLQKYDFDVSNFAHPYQIRISIHSTSEIPFSLSVGYQHLPNLVSYSVPLAAVILLFVYVLIIFDIVHRAIAAILGSTAALSLLAITNQRPLFETIMEWLDYETLTLLFGMMVIVAIFCDTGFFDYIAYLAYKSANGKIWPLVSMLCLFTGVVSAVLDNVTTILLMAPVTIKLCEALNADPRPILIAQVLFSNIGGTATAIGDPPNVIIVSNSEIARKGIDFAEFSLHMLIGACAAFITGYGYLRFHYRKDDAFVNPEPMEIIELKREIKIWQLSYEQVTPLTREGNTVRALLMQKVTTLENKLNKKLNQSRESLKRDFQANLVELEKTYRITDYVLLTKCLVILAFVMIFFFSYSFLDFINLTIGWIALFGSIALLILANIGDLEVILHRVEWATLIFFAALFVLMEGLNELGLIDWIGDQVASMISGVDESARLSVAIIVILWISAITSAFVDNIPYTTALIPIILRLADDPSLNLPLEPLVWSLAFGACLGGNGTLIGASANVVCAGIAEQYGYAFSFVEFSKVGFPIMIVTVFTANAYLLIAHVVLKW